jgi:hypothetical protein
MILKTALLFVALNIVMFVAEWRMKRLERLNEEILMRLDDSNEDKLERKMHQNKKWAKFD